MKTKTLLTTNKAYWLVHEYNNVKLFSLYNGAEFSLHKKPQPQTNPKSHTPSKSTPSLNSQQTFELRM